jgi:hypothetical protein
MNCQPLAPLTAWLAMSALLPTLVCFNVCAGLSQAEQVYLDQLLLREQRQSIATLNLLKSPPKSATLSHMQELLAKFNSLMSFGDAKRLLSGIARSKVKSFAAQAKALDVSEFQDIS